MTEFTASSSASAGPSGQSALGLLPPPSSLRSYDELSELMKASADALSRMDLLALVAEPLAIDSPLSAFVWAKAIPLAMTERRRTPGYSLADEQRDDVIFDLRDAGEVYLAQVRPTDSFEALLLITVVADQCGDMQPELAAMIQRVQEWLVTQVAA